VGAGAIKVLRLIIRWCSVGLTCWWGRVTADNGRIVFSEKEQTLSADLFPCCWVRLEVGEQSDPARGAASNYIRQLGEGKVLHAQSAMLDR
jgi:hypothetical protein